MDEDLAIAGLGYYFQGVEGVEVEEEEVEPQRVDYHHHLEVWEEGVPHCLGVDHPHHLVVEEEGVHCQGVAHLDHSQEEWVED